MTCRSLNESERVTKDLFTQVYFYCGAQLASDPEGDGVGHFIGVDCLSSYGVRVPVEFLDAENAGGITVTDKFLASGQDFETWANTQIDALCAGFRHSEPCYVTAHFIYIDYGTATFCSVAETNDDDLRSHGRLVKP